MTNSSSDDILLCYGCLFEKEFFKFRTNFKKKRKYSLFCRKCEREMGYIKNIEFLSYKRQKYSVNPLLKLKQTMRSRMTTVMKNNAFLKDSNLNDYLGCSIEEFYKYIENQFQLGMTWDNYGNKIGQWSLDHIIPLSYAENENDIYVLSYYTNFQPLWHIENLKKSDQLDKKSLDFFV